MNSFLAGFLTGFTTLLLLSALVCLLLAWAARDHLPPPRS